MADAGERASVMDRPGGVASVSGPLIPAQRGQVTVSDIPSEWRRRRAGLPSWPRATGRSLELASTSLLGLGVALAADSPWVSLLALSLWVLGAYGTDRTVITPLAQELRSVVYAAFLPITLLTLGAASAVLSAHQLRQALLSLALPAALAALVLGLRHALQSPVRVVAVGDRAFVSKTVTLLPRTSRGRVVAAVVAEDELKPEDVPLQILGTPTYGDLERVSGVVADHRGDLVLVDSARGVSADEFRRLSWALEGAEVAIGAAGIFGSVAPARLRPGRLGAVSVLDVREPRPSTVVRGAKRGFDQVVGLLALIAVSPLILLLMLVVKWDSPGPAIFVQTRIGKHCKPFRMRKLRTMVVGSDDHKHLLDEANEADSVLFKIRQDPRITRVGGFLRRTSLDELPQLINVVRGEMSLVGPRPHLPVEVEAMDPSTLRRHAVSPGITGLWQVSGRADLTWSEASALDTDYADNWSLGGDAVILARTVRAVLSQRGAY